MGNYDSITILYSSMVCVCGVGGGGDIFTLRHTCTCLTHSAIIHRYLDTQTICRLHDTPYYSNLSFLQDSITISSISSLDFTLYSTYPVLVYMYIAYLFKEFDVFRYAGVLLFEAAQNLISKLTDMLLKRVATV